MIEANGLEATEAWAKSFVKQFARSPKGGGRDQIKAAAAGLCDITVANTYYLAGMLNAKDEGQRHAAEKMGIFWPNRSSRGAHINISGGALIKTAKHKEPAIKLLEFLAGKSAQAWYAKTNGEYPIRSDVTAGETLQAWGKFTMDSINLSRLGELNSEALKLMDRAGWK
jgi:iron(III) transport system substrate-binding protein